MWPLIPHGQSDTACLDNALELLVAGGYPLAQAVMMLIPEAWAGNPLMDAKRKAFYEYHAALMEPWDGPAAVAFTDGRQIGATLDRNGLRPGPLHHHRPGPCDHGLGGRACSTIPEERIVRKWRLQPGKMLLIDMEEGRIIEDEEIKRTLAEAEPYEEWLAETQFKLEDLSLTAEPERAAPNDPADAARSPAGVRLHPGGPARSSWSRWPRPATIRSARWAPTRPSPCSRARPEAALRVLQAELRPGHQPADRPDPRGAGDEPGLDDRPAAEPARPPRRQRTSGWRSPSRSSPTRTWRRSAAINELLDGAFRTATLDATWAGRGGRRRAWSAALERLCREATDAVLADMQHPDPVGPGDLGPTASRSRRRWPPRPCTTT